MTIDEIEVGSKWEDTLGKAKVSKKGNIVKGERLKREVIITDKTSNSIEYQDGGGYFSWITLEDFTRVENSNNKVRFIKL